jgi:hypothetical protein
MSKAGRAEILAAIRWYSKRGLDWGDVVCYLAMKHSGRLDAYMRPLSGMWRVRRGS